MKKRFYVLNGEGDTLYAGRETDDGPQSFENFAQAERRAQAAAKTEPGVTYKIVEVLAVVSCPVSPPQTRRTR